MAKGPRVQAVEQRVGLVVPTGVLQHIFCLASTWQTPGSCLAGPLSRTWRSAVTGRRSSVRLLYHAGQRAADASFATWLGRNSWQLDTLILTGSSRLVLKALAEAAAAAQAAGRPLRLHTLRVLQAGVDVHTAGQLLARLPHLRCLQLHIDVLASDLDVLMSGVPILEELAPLQAATQLEELYLKGPGVMAGEVAGLLPPSLKRLSWHPEQGMLLEQCDLSQLTQLTFLQLRYWSFEEFTSRQLPPGLQQLELLEAVGDMEDDCMEVLEEQRQLVTAWDIYELDDEDVQRLLPRLPNLKAATVHAMDLADSMDPGTLAALQQLTQLSALTVKVSHGLRGCTGLLEAVTAAASMHSLRRLHLHYGDLAAPPPLGALTQLTQLRVSMRGSGGSEEQQQQQAWAEVLGGMTRLQWLSVPDVLLTAGQACLGGLQQLRVLVLRWTEAPGSAVPWLEKCGQEGLPPKLQVLGVTGMTAAEAAAWQVRRRLQQALGSSGCEVVVGADLDEVADPTQQLAGVPAALQKALA